MALFENLFLESKGQPIMYKGQVLQMMDNLPIAGKQQIRIVFESTNSDWKQGIYVSTEGEFEIENKTIHAAAVLWEHTAPREVVLRIRSKSGKCLVKNVWDMGDGVMHSWHNGAAMIVEEEDSYRRYKCNDGRADEDFDDLIFRIEWNI